MSSHNLSKKTPQPIIQAGRLTAPLNSNVRLNVKVFGQSIIAGISVTLILFSLSYVATFFGFTQLAHVFYWQGWGLQFLVPCHDMGTLEKPFCEGSPLDAVTFFAGIPLGFVLYSVAAYLTLSVRGNNAA